MQPQRTEGLISGVSTFGHDYTAAMRGRRIPGLHKN